MLADMLEYATAVARRMMKDHIEAGSIAGSALMRVIRNYDPEKGTMPKKFIAFCVKRQVWDYWRREARRKEELRQEPFWLSVSTADVPEEPLTVSREHWMLLCEKYLDKWPLDVLARRHNVSMRQIRVILAVAEQKFKEAMGC